MSQNITYIKKELKDCEEVDSVYDIKIGQTVKYIIQENGSEYFYTGGTYLRMADNKIILKINNSFIHVPLKIINSDGSSLYKTRLFVKDNKNEECKDKNEYEKIIYTQQKIIEKLNLELTNKDKIINKLYQKYKN